MQAEGARPREEVEVVELDLGPWHEAEVDEAAGEQVVAVHPQDREAGRAGDLREAGVLSHDPFNQKADGPGKRLGGAMVGRWVCYLALWPEVRSLGGRLWYFELAAPISGTLARNIMTTDHIVLTTVPVQALAQPLIDFLSGEGVKAYAFEDETGLDAARGVEVRVASADEARAKELLGVFWAAHEGKRTEM